MTIQGFMIRFRRKTIRNVFIFNLSLSPISGKKGKMSRLSASHGQIQDNVYLLAAMGQSGDSYF
ncbi:MAG: hypothetical protein ACLUOI_16505 [Eisenbergiella sp.]